MAHVSLKIAEHSDSLVCSSETTRPLPRRPLVENSGASKGNENSNNCDNVKDDIRLLLLRVHSSGGLTSETILHAIGDTNVWGGLDLLRAKRQNADNQPV